MFTVLSLTPDPEGHKAFKLGSSMFELVTRFNYVVPAWTMDILDGSGTLVIAGLVLVPNVDILKPYAAVKQKIGALVMVEMTPGDYMSPFNLGSKLQLLWYPVGTPVVLP